MEHMNPALMWWINAIELPVIAGLFWLIVGLKREMDARMDNKEIRQLDGLTRTREELAEFKVEVARTYVPLSLIRDMDRRLAEQLLRIEEKLEDIRRESEARR